MRLISQNCVYDMDYSRCNIVYGEIGDRWAVYADNYIMGVYDSREDADTVMAAIREAYTREEAMFRFPTYKVKKAPDFVDMPIEHLELGLRTYTVLRRAGINTIGDIDAKGQLGLKRLRHIGPKTLEEITDAMTRIGAWERNDGGDRA